MSRRLSLLVGCASLCLSLPVLLPPTTAAERGKTDSPLPAVNVASLRLAVEDMAKTFGDRYDGGRYLKQIEQFERKIAELETARARGDGKPDAEIPQLVEDLVRLQREALLANPLLDFDKLLVLRRNFGDAATKVISTSLGMPSLNSHTHDTIRHRGWDNEICVLSELRGQGKLTSLYGPPNQEIICEMDLHFDGRRLMFSSIGTHDRWQLFEINTDGTGLKQLTPDDLPDVDFFDSCYLPNGKIATTSTAPYQGLPCENGGKPMACLYLLDPATMDLRQFTFEQDSDWCPTVLNNGRLLYLRWEYTDIPHYFSRILFHCNPDGTNQVAYSGSNSCFPNAFYFARPIPQHPTKVVGIAGGHHGISRSGQMLILDPARGRQEADGVVQTMLKRGQETEPIMVDRLFNGVWPHFLHPYPLSEKYFLVAAKLDSNQSLWGIYLIDVFDNMTLLKEVPGAALLEPLPLRPTQTPPVVPDKVNLKSKQAVVYLTDVNYGAGLKDVPRGTVKELRLFAYHYAYLGTGGHASCGTESSWDIKRVLGTVPVEEDGSAFFRIPANTPISIQPLDEDGAALQLMRSWMVGMPGEVVSCVGCHENQNDSVPNQRTVAALRAPSKIEPWYGSPRPFSFRYEVQPVLDKYCVGCHHPDTEHQGKGRQGTARQLAYGGRIPDLSGERGKGSYDALQRFVRRPGPESDIHMFPPMEYHAGTSELIQMLRKGHHNVQLDREAWQRLVTWIDLNAPWRGQWQPRDWRNQQQRQRRLELSRQYANLDTDPEFEYEEMVALFEDRDPIEPIMPEPPPAEKIETPRVAGWPFSSGDAGSRQSAAGAEVQRVIQLSDHVKLELSLIPAGGFVMGSVRGSADERPLAKVRIERPFWMGTMEISNQQYALFDPSHDSRYIDRSGKDHSNRGHQANAPQQPVIRIAWHRARDFCRWLSEQTGERFVLPTEAQWEWACRAGSNNDLWFGSIDDDFAQFANLADQSGGKERVTPFAFIAKVNDRVGIPRSVDGWQANPWGLKNVHGNVAEWTLSSYRGYPYHGDDGRNDPSQGGLKVVRGGSWRDRPHRATSSFRLAYQPYQRVFNVGFRVVCPANDSAAE